MIPKKIHYCWFGEKKFSKLESKCKQSWEKILPDYEFYRWDEYNFDIATNIYIKQAYELKKYAFVSDYVRLKVLEMYGGIYLDTDVEVLKTFDVFLNNEAFIGFQDDKQIQTAVIGSIPNGRWVLEMLKYYENAKFLDEKGVMNLTTNVKIISDLLIKKGIKLENTRLLVPNYLMLYPNDVFCAKNIDTGNIFQTNNTHSIHHFNASWFSFRDKQKLKLWRFIHKNIIFKRIYFFLLNKDIMDIN